MNDANSQKFLDYAGTESLWKRFLSRLNKKLESVTNHDDSIEVTSNREISVKVSVSEGNVLQLKTGAEKGLYVPSTHTANHKLIFGAGQAFVYDGTQDVVVPVYLGEYT